LDTELLHGIHGHKAVGSPLRAERGQTTAGDLHQGEVASYPEIRAYPVHGEVICGRALPVHAEQALIVERRRRNNHARREHDERLGVASIQRHILDKGHRPLICQRTVTTAESVAPSEVTATD